MRNNKTQQMTGNKGMQEYYEKQQNTTNCNKTKKAPSLFLGLPAGRQGRWPRTAGTEG
jgi:hypothetical protein